MSGSKSARTHLDITLVWRPDRTETVRGDDTQTILEAAESDGIHIPVGCCTGCCGTCVGRLVDGDVRYERPPRALKPRYSKAGYVLCCIARPQRECRIAVGSDVHAEMVPSPWK
jgi:ferredoxin